MLIAALIPAAPALARPYVTAIDTGGYFATLNTQSNSIPAVSAKLMALYDGTGAVRPDILSVWLAFPLGGQSLGTIFLPQSNDVQGIGFQNVFGGDGTFTGQYGRLRNILIHNNMLVLPARASYERADPDPGNFLQYLFLLELSHTWLAAVQAPGTLPGELGTFPHWSFWYDSGGSPAGGMPWIDNRDGTFSTVPLNPIDVKYSLFDLYLMGLADPGEVPPINVLENAVPPASPMDPLYGGRYSAQSLTDFDQAPLTVSAVRHTFTLDQVVATNGPRVPARAASPSSFSLGILLLVSDGATASDIASAQATFDPLAVQLAPAFHRATSGRGTLTTVTYEDGGLDALPDAGVDGGAGDAGASDAGDAGSGSRDAGPADAGQADAGANDAGGGADAGGSSPMKSGGCQSGIGEGFVALITAGAWFLRRRRRSSHSLV